MLNEKVILAVAMNKSWLAIGILIALPGLAWAQDGTDIGVSIHKPLRSSSQFTPYEPERIIHMTVHDYVGARKDSVKYETTGRFVTFGLPMKYIDARMMFSDRALERLITFTGWEQQGEGSAGTIINIHDPEGLAPRGTANSNRFRAWATHFSTPSHGVLPRELVAANRAGANFDGYKKRSKPGQSYWLAETYCGFEVFEQDSERYWHREARAIEGIEVPEGVVPPFDHARVFGLPDGNGGYQRIVECDDSKETATSYCKTDGAFNDYVHVRYGFDGSLLCQIEDVIKAHHELLRMSIIEEQSEKNNKWRNR